MSHCINPAVAPAAEITPQTSGRILSTYEDSRFVLKATWLRTLCKARMVEDGMVQGFLQGAHEHLTKEELSYKRVTLILEQVASEFSRSGRVPDVIAITTFGYEAAAREGDARMACHLSYHIAELTSAANDINATKLFLGKASLWTEKISQPSNDDERQQWTIGLVNDAVVRGRALAIHWPVPPAHFSINSSMAFQPRRLK